MNEKTLILWQPPKKVAVKAVEAALVAAGFRYVSVKGDGEGGRCFLVDFRDEGAARRALKQGTLLVQGKACKWERPAGVGPPLAQAETPVVAAPCEHGEGFRPAPAPVAGDEDPRDKPRPYRHVAVDLKKTLVDQPVGHDEEPGGSLTGELRIEIVALTPLLVGNEQYEARLLEGASSPEPDDRDAHNEIIAEAERRHPGDLPDVHRKRQEFGKSILIQRRESDERLVHATEKQVVEPLRLPDGRVLIPGASLKGMLRQSIGALTDAPMERVGERTYSYRPNLSFPQGAELALTVRPALVESVDAGGLPHTVTVYKPVGWNVLRNRWNSSPANRYRGGMEAKGCRSVLPFERKRLRYSLKLEGLNVAEEEVEVPPFVRLWYRQTLRHLADSEEGHVSSRHPDGKETLEAAGRHFRELLKSGGFQKGDAIFVEWDEVNGRVVSFGHHYYYRWRYLDSVRRRWTGADADGEPTFEERRVLCPTAREKSQEPDGSPTGLTGARLLHGYAGDDEGSAGIGKADWTQLAGRLAFNAAVEVLAEGKEGGDDSRFVSLRGSPLLPLRELGLPRPSAVEFYLRPSPTETQPSGRRSSDLAWLRTYGDALDVNGHGAPVHRDSPGELAGRKFYPHPPLDWRGHADGLKHSCYLDDAQANWFDKRSNLARCVSRKGTTFRCTLRFRHLRPWELGLVLLALQPDRFLPGPDGSDVAPNPPNPRFAQKLGRGRPFGLGSVSISVVEAWRLVLGKDEDGQPPSRPTLQRIADADLCMHAQSAQARIDGGTLGEWSRLMDWRNPLGAPYPAVKNEIYAWHTRQRVAHSKARRKKP